MVTRSPGPVMTQRDEVMTHLKPPSIIDGTTLRAVVGRIFDRDKWVIVKREGNMEHAEYVGINFAQ